MHATILMSLLVYDCLIDRCNETSREFAILNNGVIIRRYKEDHFERILEIRCDISDADRLLYLATTAYPEAVEEIAKAITAARNSD